MTVILIVVIGVLFVGAVFLGLWHKSKRGNLPQAWTKMAGAEVKLAGMAQDWLHRSASQTIKASAVKVDVVDRLS